MSTIAKIAVYDPRLVQDAPAYAVQKGALSVSVAQFQAISANSSAMTFQVLVPSLNVFVDRKIQLSTALNFTAQLFYGGPRGLSVKNFTGPGASGGKGKIIGTTLTFADAPIVNGAARQLPYGTLVYSTSATSQGYYDSAGTNPNGTGVLPGTYIVGSSDPTTYTVNISQTVNAWTDSTAPADVGYIACVLPAGWTVPDPMAGVQFELGADIGFSNATQSGSFCPLGYATAVSAKDLALVPFPVQSSLNNMTATLNDCTVTTNGDTLREQIMLTATRDNLKQRTTPTKQDVYSWGRDDALNSSGNFASYSVADTWGDLPTGSFPMTWYSDASQQSPLAAISAVAGAIVGASVPNYPFLAPGAVGSFNLEVGPNFTASGGSGCGWYIAQQASTNVTGSAKNPVVVPFVNGQPVWTTGFPGGDLISLGNNYSIGGGIGVMTAADYTIDAANTLVLLKSVPPYCMIGARVYATGGDSTVILGWVSSLQAGSLGCINSSYTVTSALGNTMTGNTCLQAGFQVTTGPMPVFGSVATVEPLVISPLIWADSAEFQTVGLYGMTNMQFVLNFGTLGTCFAAQNPAANITSRQFATLPYWVDDLTRPTNYVGNIIRSSNIRTVISDLAFGSSANQYGPWTNPSLFTTFLTPGPDITLPLVSSVPYVEFPRYQTTRTVTGTGSQTVSTNTISLTSIPDMIMLYVKPSTKGPSQLDQYIPIQNVQITFDNFSNLCSGFQQFNLYQSAVAAGLDMDWHQWRGYTQAAYPSLARSSAQPQGTLVSTPIMFKQTGFTQLSGGPILLRMGHDITLSPGLAPGCLGNYSFQAVMQTSNPYGYYDYVSSVQVTLIAINTGFFETVRGQSAIRKTILNSADVEAANPESGTTSTHLARMVGRGAGYLMGGNTAVMHAKHHRLGSDGGGQQQQLSGGAMKRPRGSGSGL